MWGLEDFLKFLITNWDSYEDRLVENTKQDEYEIDTCFANDKNKYETGIRKNDGEWIVVEEYNTKEDAKQQHKKWIEFTKCKPQKAYSIQFEEYTEF